MPIKSARQYKIRFLLQRDSLKARFKFSKIFSNSRIEFFTNIVLFWVLCNSNSLEVVSLAPLASSDDVGGGKNLEPYFLPRLKSDHDDFAAGNYRAIKSVEERKSTRPFSCTTRPVVIHDRACSRGIASLHKAVPL